MIASLALPAAASAQSASDDVSITILPPKHPLPAQQAPHDPGPGAGKQGPPHRGLEPAADYSQLTRTLSLSTSLLVVLLIGMTALVLAERGRRALTALRL